MLKFILPALMLSAALPGAAVARDVQSDIHISYRDLDLRNQAGIDQLNRRISRAVQAVCPDPSESDLRRKMIAYRCLRVKRAEAEGQRAVVLARVNQPGVAIASTR